jgi:hypothetical protein
MHNSLSDAIAASGYNHNLLAPLIRVVAPVVRYCIVEPRTEASDQTQSKDCPEVLEGRGVFLSEYVTTSGVAPEQEQRKRESWVEHRELEKATDRIGSNACDCGQPFVIPRNSSSWCSLSCAAHIPSRERLHSLRIGILRCLSVAVNRKAITDYSKEAARRPANGK